MNIDQLITEFLNAKASEQAAKDRRISLEEQIVKALDAPEGKSKTYTIGQLKVSVKGSWRFSADTDALMNELGSAKDVPVDLKYEFNGTRYKALEESNPELYNAVAKYVTRKASKPSVTISM